MTSALIRFCMEQRLLVSLAVLMLVTWGIIVSPFRHSVADLPRDPIPVDAIPDLGDNQQIVFTEWPGRSPQDIEDQVTYPLTTALLGIPGVKSIRSESMFGFSSIYVIFDESIEFYWSRSRILEKINSLPEGTLPAGVRPMLGPDATGMGQIFWYTVEGRTPDGKPVGGWDLHELRSVQDWYIRYALQGTEGVAEVASVGGFVREYQIDVNPDSMRALDVSLMQVMEAVRRSNRDVGARTLENNGVEYVLRGKGFIKEIDELRASVITTRNGVPITLEQVATVSLGPAMRRGALDKGGTEAVGGVVVARFGANPMEVIDNVKRKIEEIAPGLPRRTLEDGTISQLTIVPFYDRTGLIEETLGTLEDALWNQILITLVVVLLMVFHLRSSILIGAMLPLAVLFTFIMMKTFGVQANLVALAGIAIAIGTVVDMGIVLTENMLQHLRDAKPGESRFVVLHRAAAEVGSAVLTAIATTIVSFLPVFVMTGAEGKLFQPLAFTKTFALFSSIATALMVLPPMAVVLFRWQPPKPPEWLRKSWRAVHLGIVILLSILVIVALARVWEPLGGMKTTGENLLFVSVVVVGLLSLFWLWRITYEAVLGWCLRFKTVFLAVPILLVMLGGCVWLGFPRTFGWLPDGIRESPMGETLAEAFPGLGREFMPVLDEGGFLYMPVTMPHGSIGEAMEYMRQTDMAMQAIPEVDLVVGKLGRAESPLDPAPVSMLETVIQYKPEYVQDEQGRRVSFAYDRDRGKYQRDADGNLIPDPSGRPFRNWRPEIKSPEDIWAQIVEATHVPGLTSAPKLAPIAARQVMLQSGMRAPMGVKVRGPDLETIERVALRMEEILKSGRVPGVRTSAVVAERLVGVPYLEIIPDRDAIARHGLRINDVMEVIEVAIGGMPLTQTVEGRERYPVRVRYARELRDSIDELANILIDAPPVVDGGPMVRIPLREVADIQYTRGPMSIRSEDTFLVGYVLFDRMDGFAEVDVVENARAALRAELDPELPAGVSYNFAGNYESQIRAAKTLQLILPLTLLLIFVILYLCFRSTVMTFMIFSNVFVAWSGGFIFLWLWAQPWFMDFMVLGSNLREVFHMGEMNLSIAVWVGFLALFGLATDDGVIMATYIREGLEAKPPTNVAQLRATIINAAKRRIRPCLMTSATTILALLPVMTSPGKGSEIMTPLAIPLFGGMSLVMISVFVVPVLYCALEEFKMAVAELRTAVGTPSPVAAEPSPQS
jgi:Cu(I)/Ag(I) efflux system membrane protein CusA/SilA